MDLTPVQISELAVGQPLPWDLFDQDRQQLLARGHVINTPDELQVLGKSTVFRQQETSSAPAAPTPPQSTGVAARQHQFEDMQLHVGDKLQLSRSSSTGGGHCIVKLIGYVENTTLIVGAPPSGQWRQPVIEGDQLAIRVFSSQNAFGFNAYVDKVMKVPFAYLHLSFPKQIIGKVIRKSRRIKTEIPATIDGNPTPVVVSNLSATGAELRTSVNPGALGTTIRISFALKIYDVETPLSIQTVIRSLKQDQSDAEGALRCGLEFQGLQPNEIAALQNLIYHELVEHPKSIV